MSRATDIAWLAGVVEGEGWIGVVSHSHPLPRMSVDQIDPWLPNRIREKFGGNVRSNAVTSAGNRIYRWDASGARARGILLSIYTLLSPKKQERIRAALDV